MLGGCSTLPTTAKRTDYLETYDTVPNRFVRFALEQWRDLAEDVESALAAKYRASHGPYLGNSLAGRVDGNLFLVFWLGNMVGSRDEDGRFFKEELDHLPAAIVNETRRRNTEYVRWLAGHLFG